MQSKNYSLQQTVLQSLLASFLLCCCFALATDASAQVFENTYLSQENHSGYSVLTTQNSTGGYIMAGTAFGASAGGPASSSINVIEVDMNGVIMWNKHYDLGSYIARGFHINHAPEGYIISGMVMTGNNNHACLLYINFNGAVLNSVVYDDLIFNANSQALHTVFSYNDFTFTTVGFINDDNYDNVGNKQAFIVRSDNNLNILCNQFFDTPHIAGSTDFDYDMAEHVTDLQGMGYFVTGSMNVSTNVNKQGILALHIDDNCNLVNNASFKSGYNNEVGVSAVFDFQNIHLLSNSNELQSFQLTTLDLGLNIINHVGFDACCSSFSGFSMKENNYNNNNLVIAGHVRSQDFMDSFGNTSLDNTPPFLVEVEKNSGYIVTAGVMPRLYQVTNNFNGMVDYRNYGGFYQPFTGQKPFIFTPEMLTTTPNGEFALVSHRTNFSNELDIELIKTDMFGSATQCEDPIDFFPFSQSYVLHQGITTNVGLVSHYPMFWETDLMPDLMPVCNSTIYPCDDPAIYGAVGLNLLNLGSGMIDAGLNLPAGASLVNWNVDFGDGSPANTYGSSPVGHTYALAGTYNVCAWGSYIINNVECFFQICESIFVDSDPCDITFTFTPNPTAPYAYDFVANYAGGLTVVSIDWDFGDGNFGTGNPTTHVYISSGIYSVCATIVLADSAGNIYTCVACYPITVNYICDPSLVGLNLVDLGSNVVEAGVLFPAGASLINWTVDFGDGNPPNSYGTSPINYTYVSPGVYLVCAWGTYIINNIVCDFQVCDEIIIVNDDPCDDILFTYTSSPIAPYSYDFVANYTGGLTLVSVDWIFGDGNIGTGNPITHTYTASGTYFVCAIFTFVDAAGMTYVCEWCEDVVVGYICDPSLIGLNLVDLGSNVVEAGVLFPAGASLISWTVDFGDGNPPNSYGTSPINYTYVSPGVYLVCAWGTYVINNVICDFQVCDEIIIESQGDPCTDANLGMNLFPNGLELGVSPLFDPSIVAAWEINFGDGNTTGINTGVPYSAVHNYTAGGFYTVCLFVWIIDPFTGAEILCEICEEIYIDPCTSNPPLDFDININGSTVDVCPIITTPIITGIISWNWDFQNGTIINDNTPNCQTYTYTNGGVYVICLTVLYEMNDGSIMECVVCKEVIIEDWCNETGLSLEYQQNTHIGLLPNVITGYQYELTWDFGDGTIFVTDQPTLAQHTYTNGGVYTVCLMITIMDANGNIVAVCYHYITIEVTDPCFGIAVTLDGVHPSCNINNGLLEATVVGGTLPYTFNWINNTTNTSVFAGGQISGLEAGDYTVIVTDANGCQATANFVLEQEDCPCGVVAPTGLTTTINFPQVTLAWNSVAGAVQYQLAGKKQGGAVKIFPPQNTTSRTFLGGIQANTTYQWAVRAICADGSVSDWSNIETFTTPNAKNASNESHIADPFETNETALTAKAYPNPATNNVSIEYTLSENTWNDHIEINITVIDLLGRTLISQKVTDQTMHNKIDLDISQLSTGTYILQIDNGIDQHIEKLSVAH